MKLCRRSIGPALALVIPGVLASCAPAEEAPEAPVDETVEEVAPEGPTLVRGFLVLGEETRSIKPCGEERELWVVPISDVAEAYRSLTADRASPVYVEVEGDVGPAPDTGPGARFPGQLRITALRRATPAAESFACDEDLSSFAFKAAGVEPFWAAEIGSSAIVYSTPDLPRTVFSGAEPSFAGGGWVYETTATGPEPLTLEIRIEPGRCSDSMVGAVYRWTATLTLAGEERRGCAWEGLQAPR